MNIFACFFYFDILYSSLHISMGPNKMASKNVQVYDLGWGGLTYSLMTIKCLTWYFFYLKLQQASSPTVSTELYLTFKFHNESPMLNTVAYKFKIQYKEAL